MVHSVALFSRSGAIEIFGWPIFPETHNGRKIFGFIFMSPSLSDATQCMQIGMTPRSTPPRDKVEPANRRRPVAIMGGWPATQGGKIFPAGCLFGILEMFNCLSSAYEGVQISAGQRQQPVSRHFRTNGIDRNSVSNRAKIFNISWSRHTVKRRKNVECEKVKVFVWFKCG